MQRFIDNVIHGDCAKIMCDISDNFIDLTLTSPPYDNLRDYEGYEFNFYKIAKELYRITKHGGVVVWVVSDQTVDGSETGTSFRQALAFMDIGFKLHDTMIFEKINPLPQNHNRYEQSFEYMFVFSKGKVNTFNPLMEETKNSGQILEWGKRRTDFHINQCRRKRESELIEVKLFKRRRNIFKYAVGGNKIKGHPAPFPDKLAEDHILTWTNKGDIVFDPMCGSGTTLKMAHKNDRNYIGIDCSKKYVELSIRHLKGAA